MPTMSCNVPCGHAWTGCVATAMSQVMKYYNYPTNYNWTDMPNNYATNSTAILMKDIGNAIDMDYQYDGSGASMNDVPGAFRNDFNYNHASHADYSYQTVMNELDYNRPVILSGGRNNGWWIFGHYTDGHAWVCDGYLETVDPCCCTYLSLHMNWGWNGAYNGWFYFNDFNPANYTFNYDTEMIYNIHP